MTAVDVDALDKLREAATPGEWYQARRIHLFSDATSHPGIGETYMPADAALIVAAVNALEPLLAEVRRGRALREAVEGLAKELDRQADGPIGIVPTPTLVHGIADRLRAALRAHRADVVTAVDVDALVKLREALAVTLATHRLVTPRQCFCGAREPYDERDAGFHRPEWHIAHALMALLPVVDRIANERAAAALEAAAYTVNNERTGSWLLARATALREPTR